jgi:hypothetical protein
LGGDEERHSSSEPSSSSSPLHIASKASVLVQDRWRGHELVLLDALAAVKDMEAEVKRRTSLQK